MTPAERDEFWRWFFEFGLGVLRDHKAGEMPADEREIMGIAVGEGEEDALPLERIEAVANGSEDGEKAEARGRERLSAEALGLDLKGGG